MYGVVAIKSNGFIAIMRYVIFIVSSVTLQVPVLQERKKSGGGTTSHSGYSKWGMVRLEVGILSKFFIFNDLGDVDFIFPIYASYAMHMTSAEVVEGAVEIIRLGDDYVEGQRAIYINSRDLFLGKRRVCNMRPVTCRWVDDNIEASAESGSYYEIRYHLLEYSASWNAARPS